MLSIANRTGTKFILNIFWKNPLNVTLTKGILRISGGYIAAQDVWIGTVPGHGSVNQQLLEVYHYSEEGEDIVVFVKFISNEIPVMNAQITVPQEKKKR